MTTTGKDDREHSLRLRPAEAAECRDVGHASIDEPAQRDRQDDEARERGDQRDREQPRRDDIDRLQDGALGLAGRLGLELTDRVALARPISRPADERGRDGLVGEPDREDRVAEAADAVSVPVEERSAW